MTFGTTISSTGRYSTLADKWRDMTIEFAKMIPGFMKFPQGDQISLLKGGKITLLSGHIIAFSQASAWRKVKGPH